MPLQKLARYQLFLGRLLKVLPCNSHAREQITLVLDLMRRRTAELDTMEGSFPSGSDFEAAKSPLPKILRPMREAVLRCKAFVWNGFSRNNPVCVSTM